MPRGGRKGGRSGRELRRLPSASMLHGKARDWDPDTAVFSGPSSQSSEDGSLRRAGSGTIGLGELCVAGEPLGLGHSLPLALETCGSPIVASPADVPFTRQPLQQFLHAQRSADSGAVRSEAVEPAAASSSSVPASPRSDLEQQDSTGSMGAPRRHIFRPFVPRIVAPDIGPGSGDAAPDSHSYVHGCAHSGRQTLEVHAIDDDDASSHDSLQDEEHWRTWQSSGDISPTAESPVKLAAAPHQLPGCPPQSWFITPSNASSIDSGASNMSRSSSAHSADSTGSGALAVTGEGATMPADCSQDLVAQSLKPVRTRKAQHVAAGAAQLRCSPAQQVATPPFAQAPTPRAPVSRSQSHTGSQAVAYTPIQPAERARSLTSLGSGRDDRRMSLLDAYAGLQSHNQMLSLAIDHDVEMEAAAERQSSGDFAASRSLGSVEGMHLWFPA